MSTYTVIWHKSWEGLAVPSREACDHPCTDVLAINHRLEPHGRGQQRIAMDGNVCMLCGADTTGNLSFRDGLALCMENHGWNARAGHRLYEIAAANEQELFEANERLPLWFAFAWNWPWGRIKASLEAAAAEDALAAEAPHA